MGASERERSLRDRGGRDGQPRCDDELIVGAVVNEHDARRGVEDWRRTGFDDARVKTSRVGRGSTGAGGCFGPVNEIGRIGESIWSVLPAAVPSSTSNTCRRFFRARWRRTSSNLGSSS